MASRTATTPQSFHPLGRCALKPTVKGCFERPVWLGQSQASSIPLAGRDAGGLKAPHPGSPGPIRLRLVGPAASSCWEAAFPAHSDKFLAVGAALQPPRPCLGEAALERGGLKALWLQWRIPMVPLHSSLICCRHCWLGQKWDAPTPPRGPAGRAQPWLGIASLINLLCSIMAGPWAALGTSSSTQTILLLLHSPCPLFSQLLFPRIFYSLSALTGPTRKLEQSPWPPIWLQPHGGMEGEHP